MQSIDQVVPTNASEDLKSVLRSVQKTDLKLEKTDFYFRVLMFYMVFVAEIEC